MQESPLYDPFLYIGFLGGMLLAIAVVLLNYSVMNGIVGPATTIANMSGVL